MSSPQSITSAKNARVKRAVKLRQRRARRQQGRTIVDGMRETRLALQADWTLAELFCRRSRFDGPDIQSLVATALAKSADVFVVDDDVFEKLAFGERDEAVAATLETPSLELAQLPGLPANPLICVLDQIEKPGNLGAVLRTLDAVGADALILTDPVTDVFNPNTIRASLGAVFQVPMAVAGVDVAIQWLLDRRIKVWTARVDGQSKYDQCDFRSACALVFGSEAHGLGDAWRRSELESFYLPMRGEVDSLNVSASAAIALYEAVRQRGAA